MVIPDLDFTHRPLGAPKGYLFAADGQGLVKHRPSYCLLTTGRRHGAHIAIVTMEVLCRWDDVGQSEVSDLC